MGQQYSVTRVTYLTAEWREAHHHGVQGPAEWRQILGEGWRLSVRVDVQTRAGPLLFLEPPLRFSRADFADNVAR